MPGTTSFSAGNFTLSGWVADFTTGTPIANNPATPQPLQLAQDFAAPSFDFNWSAGTNSLDNLGNPGTDASQQIGASAGTDLVSLSIHFDQTTPGPVLANGGGPLLTAASGLTFTIGDTVGESATQMQSDIRSLQITDPNLNELFSITFTMTDVTTAQSTNFQEFFWTACYAPGTRIATPAGEVAVEDLQIGDLVATTSGEAKPVKWIGRRSYSAAALAEAVNLRPVMIRKDALAAGLPRRDLVVSPMHALLIDEVFVPAAALVNGVSILRRETAGAAEYIHIELDQHDVIFAEGAPAETFVDDNSRAMFENVSEYYDLYGIAESPRGYSAPRLEGGYQLEAIRRRLAAGGPQAAVPGALAGHVERLEDGMLEGWVMDRANPTAPVELEVLVDGEIVATVLANRYRVDLDRARLAGGRCAFTVAMPASAEDLSQVEVRRASDGGQVAIPQRALVTA
jgi:hypothetical protein